MDIRQIIIHPNKQSNDPLSQPIFYQTFDTKGDTQVDTKGNTRTDTQTNIYHESDPMTHSRDQIFNEILNYIHQKHHNLTISHSWE